MSQEVATNARCIVCKVESNRRCGKCSVVYYCSKEHQHEDWKRHKRECIKKDKTKEKSKNTVNNENVTNSKVRQKTPKATYVEEYKGDRGRNEIESIIDLKCKEKNCEEIEFCVTPNASHELSTHFKSPNSRPSGSKSDTEQSVKDLTTKLSKGRVSSSVVYTENEAITYEGSSENEILSASTQKISSSNSVPNSSGSTSNVLNSVKNPSDNMLAMPGYTVESAQKGHSHKNHPEVTPFCHNKNNFVTEPSDPEYEICQTVIRDMTLYGVCVLDNFLGRDRGTLVLNEVLNMYQSGIFQVTFKL